MSYKLVRRTGTTLGVVLLAGCTAAAAPALAASQHLGDRTLKQGMKGHDVRVLQDYLTRAGFQTPIVGRFGPITATNVKRFERRYKLRTDGVVTPTIARDLRLVVAIVEAKRASTMSPSGIADKQAVTGAGTGSGSSGGATIDDPATGPGFAPPPTTPGTLNSDGTAVPPANAPVVIQKIFAAANRIASLPYVYGGGHGSFNDTGYDCSGSVSYALHGGGLLSAPLDSSELESYGSPGRGRWITIYANSAHTFMIIAGLRFDTGAQSSTGGSRWISTMRSTSGYVAVHPPGW